MAEMASVNLRAHYFLPGTLELGSMATPVLGKSMARGKWALSSISPGLVSVYRGYRSSTRPRPQASTSGLKSNLLALESNPLPQFSLLPSYSVQT